MTLRLILIVLFCGTLNAEESFVKPIPAEIASPWTTKARPWLLGGAAATLGLVIFEDQIIDPTQDETVENKPLGKWSKIGDYNGQMYPNALYAGGMLITYWADGNKKALNRSRMMLMASIYAVTTSSAIKYAVREPRPYAHGDNLSFPSGHTTSAFAFASFVAAEHGMWPIGTIALAMSTFTAYSRINDNKHFLHDVVAGATIGTAYGLGVHYVNRRNSETADFPAWRVLPVAGQDPGLTLQHDF